MDLHELHCRDVSAKLLFYVNNELGETQRQAVELHLAGCSRCQEELKAVAATQSLLQQGFRDLSEKTVPLWMWVELEQRLAPRLSNVRSSRSSGVVPRIKSLASWQPRWRLVLSSALAIAMITSLAVFVSGLLGPSPEALATQIATGDPGVTALLQGKPTPQATVVSAKEGYVMSEGPSGESVLAYVDLPTGTVVKVYRISVPPLSEEDKNKIVGVAVADPRLQQVLSKEFTLRSVTLLPARFRLELAGDEPRLWSEDVLAQLVFRGDGHTWIAVVDLTGNRVVDVSELELTEPQPTQSWFYINPPYSREELVTIAWSNSDAAELLQNGAEVVSAVAGGQNMGDQGALILKLGQDLWVVRIDLAGSTVTAVEPVPVATWQSGYFFKPGNDNVT